MELRILSLLPWELMCPGWARIRLCIRSCISIAASVDEEPTVEEGNEKLWEMWQIVVGVKESMFWTRLVEEKNISINVYDSLMCRKIWLNSSRKASSGNKKNLKTDCNSLKGIFLTHKELLKIEEKKTPKTIQKNGQSLWMVLQRGNAMTPVQIYDKNSTSSEYETCKVTLYWDITSQLSDWQQSIFQQHILLIQLSGNKSSHKLLVKVQRIQLHGGGGEWGIWTIQQITNSHNL